MTTATMARDEGIRIALSVQEVARALRIREPRVRQEIHEGRMKAARIGRLWRVPVTELERYLEARITG